ncbi:MAG: OmpH family outer membrane protein, partial [Novosphingobium sp.]|nr:OmpH family outer membrane protein [Novosphingobium sp.]
QQAATIQQIQESGQREIQGIMQPVALSSAYVEEQINDKLSAAVDAAAKNAKVSLILAPDTVLFADEGYNLTQQVLDELNKLIPSAQLVPPQGWLPRQMREQQGGQGEAPAQPAGPAPASR